MPLLCHICWMVWTVWDWLSALIFFIFLLVAVMSWPNNLNPNYRSSQQPSQSQQRAATAPPAGSSVARTAITTMTRPADATGASHSPSMDMSLPPTPPTVSFPTPAEEHEYIATLLQHAHASMAQQKPMQALGLVLAAVRQQRGEEGVFDVLNETREGFGLKAHANPVRQQREMLQQQQLQQMDSGMAALTLQSATVALQDQYANANRLQLPAGSGGYEDTEMVDDSQGEYVDVECEEEEEYEDEGEASIVDEDLVDEAVRAGTHVQCRACGGVIARSRMEAHVKFWCEANHEDG